MKASPFSGAVMLALTQGYWTTVDEADLELVLTRSWSIGGSRRNYAHTGVSQFNRYQLLHRFLLQAPVGIQVDHANADSLDNRRCNIRLCSASENQANKRSYVNSLGFRGIYLSPYGVYQATIANGGKRLHLGSFSTKEEAAKAYDAAAIKQWGQFAVLNFPINHKLAAE